MSTRARGTGEETTLRIGCGRLLSLKDGGALDVGCGNGAISLVLAQLGCEVIGADLSYTAVSNAAKRPEGGPGWRPISCVGSVRACRFLADPLT